MSINRLASIVAISVCFCASSAFAQLKMPDKFDQKCLDEAGKRYVSCMANSGKSEVAKQKCGDTMAEEKKMCKKK